MKRHLLAMLALVGLMLSATAAPAFAYDFPSANDANRAAGLPHVNLVGSEAGEVTLEFVNDTNSLAFFEYRIDGETPESCNEPHPVVTEDCIYPGVAVDSRNIEETVTTTRTFEAGSTVEVRLALGGERDWDFDWVTFQVPADASAKADCKQGGWEEFGFRNQGQCIRYVNTGKDSRE